MANKPNKKRADRHHATVSSYLERKEKEIDEHLGYVEDHTKNIEELSKQTRMSRGRLFGRARAKGLYFKKAAFLKEKAILESTSLGDLIK